MMTKINNASPLAFLAPIGWQELLIMGCFPLSALAIVFTVLYLTGVIGNRKNKP